MRQRRRHTPVLLTARGSEPTRLRALVDRVRDLQRGRAARARAILELEVLAHPEAVPDRAGGQPDLVAAA